GGRHVVVRRDGRGLVLRVTERPADTLHRPSVDVTFRSVAEVPVPDALAVVLTGMGSDGAQGAAAIKARGGAVVAQSPETCVVYGMPRAVVEAGVADAVLPIDRIAPAIREAVS
ncbi:MAG: chemotaxis protein CheB, partial [Deltaproteobacteria bacterium]|nr:chemotaxis protein CheB [Deltaproteobacteria bacterium]